MTLTIDFPTELERRLNARAAATGKPVADLVREAVEEKLQSPFPTFAEILAPIHQDYRNSDMSEEDLNVLLEETLAESRRERQNQQGSQS